LRIFPMIRRIAFESSITIARMLTRPPKRFSPLKRPVDSQVFKALRQYSVLKSQSKTDTSGEGVNS